MRNRFVQTTILSVAALLLSSEYSFACSCLYQGGFVEYSKGRTVIRGTVKSYGPKLGHGKTFHETMTVSVDKLIQGSFGHPIIEFMGNPGDQCLTYVDSETYPIGSEHLFTVFSKDEKQGLGGCGEVSVLIAGDTVNSGKLNDKYQWIPYSEDYDKFILTLTPPSSSKDTETLKDSQPVPKSQPLQKPQPLQEPKKKPWWKFW